MTAPRRTTGDLRGSSDAASDDPAPPAGPLADAECRTRRLATGDWRLATGDWRLATGNWQRATDGRPKNDDCRRRPSRPLDTLSRARIACAERSIEGFPAAARR